MYFGNICLFVVRKNYSLGTTEMSLLECYSGTKDIWEMLLLFLYVLPLIGRVIIVPRGGRRGLMDPKAQCFHRVLALSQSASTFNGIFMSLVETCILISRPLVH